MPASALRMLNNVNPGYITHKSLLQPYLREQAITFRLLPYFCQPIQGKCDHAVKRIIAEGLQVDDDRQGNGGNL